ncbi:glycosyltransferase family 2 protein [Candidatus Pelagibacter sp.]|nr:glycosyltransferase family 2 protein [Candidatus Pelagibacter sp.]
MKNYELDILMPVHNEEKIIPNLINKIHNNIYGKINYRFIICEDGSSDNSLEVIKKLQEKFPITLITSKNKRGYSLAMLEGIKSSKANYLLMMDSDGQSNPDEILNFWANKDKANIICGNRSNRDDYMYRKLYSKIALTLYKILFNLSIKDPSYAFVLIEKKVYQKLSYFKPEMPDGFFWEFNARASKLGFNFYNIDVVHNKRQYGETRIYSLKNLPKVTFYNLIGLLKVRFSNENN